MSFAGIMEWQITLPQMKLLPVRRRTFIVLASDEKKARRVARHQRGYGCLPNGTKVDKVAT